MRAQSVGLSWGGTGASILSLWLGCLAAAFGSETFSESGRYSVELTRNSEGKVLVAVFQHQDEARKLVRSKPIDWEPAFPGFRDSYVNDIKALITEDGKTVVLRDRGTSEEKNGLQVLGGDWEEVKRLQVFQRRQLTGASGERSNFRDGAVYMHVSAILEFLLDDNRLALWFGQTDSWLIVSLKDGSSEIVRGEKEIDRLNTRALAFAEQRVREHQPGPVRKALDALTIGVGKLIPAFAPPAPRFLPNWPDLLSSYVFLATRKRPSDKAFLERMTYFRAERSDYGTITRIGGVEAPEISFRGGSFQRLVGDFLLDRWNGETNRDSIARETFLLVPDDHYRHLGIVRLNLELPAAVPKAMATLWAYLIPEKLPPGGWKSEGGTEVFLFNFGDYRRFVRHPLTDSLVSSVNFKAIIPGEYRVKFIWQRNPTAMSWTNKFYRAIPGDYESDESPPFTVRAGKDSEIGPVACTNRVGAASAHYEADKDQWIVDRRRSIERSAPSPFEFGLPLSE